MGWRSYDIPIGGVHHPPILVVREKRLGHAGPLVRRIIRIASGYDVVALLVVCGVA
jgi:hypothetical protein